VNRTNETPFHEEIARRAYELFEQRGREHGRDWQDWFQAERELRAQRRQWRVEAPQVSLTGNIDTATLVLRLGIAVNAVRAAQRFFDAVKDTPGPAGERDRLWAFLIALDFLYEAVKTILQPKFPQIKDLAQVGGAQDELIREAGELLSGKLPLTKTLDRMRNKLIFHWDEDPIREFASRFSKSAVVWADGVGDTQGEMFYRAAADALTNSVLPDELGAPQPESPERSIERLKALIAEVLSATDRVLKLFDFAIKGHLLEIGAKGIFS